MSAQLRMSIEGWVVAIWAWYRWWRPAELCRVQNEHRWKPSHWYLTNRINNNNPTLLKQSLITAAKPDLDNLSPHKYCSRSRVRLSSVLWSRPPDPINKAAAVSGPILLLWKPTDKYHRYLFYTFTFNPIFVKYLGFREHKQWIWAFSLFWWH